MDALGSVGSEAYDTVELVTDIESPPRARSECIAALDFKDHCVAGLSLILAVCSAISRDREAYRYTLREFNCYFFSWTIIAAVARYCVAWESLPYDSNFLYLPGDKLSQTFAQGIMDELASILPRSLPSALLNHMPKMLLINIPACAPVPPEHMNPRCADYAQQLASRLDTEPFKTKLLQILQGQTQTIIDTLRNPLNGEELRNAIENMVHEGNSPNNLDQDGLSVLLQRVLWQDDVPTLSCDMHEWTAQWCTYTNTDQIVGGRATWELISDIIVGWISRNIQDSASSRTTELVGGIVGDILGVSMSSPLPPHLSTLAPVMTSIREVIDTSVVVITECNVRYAVSQVRNRMNVTRTAIQDSIIHAVDNLFPDELPIGLRIPKAQNSRLRRLLWLARPESAFCLWRTPREIQECDSVKHRELQKYLSRRIHAHSRDVRILGVGSYEVETSIRNAMSRIWLASSKEIEGLGLDACRDESAFENGRIKILRPSQGELGVLVREEDDEEAEDKAEDEGQDCSVCLAQQRPWHKMRERKGGFDW
ncbi:unnamed protein product [Rhizoctonia solani]|uniref:Uncharacterized protein n=1 Tax=Rhizoctonia solani TaxID=456999 RepID=A0A8H3C8K6_9AGAM|nr:unnamed protein product [Rhizoctonia solani]